MTRGSRVVTVFGRPRSWILRGSVAVVAALSLVVNPASAPAATSCPATLSGTFLQPSWDVFSWSDARFDRELSDMAGVGIRTVILQWTVDMDADLAFYPSPAGWYPRGANTVGSLLAAARRSGHTVWLGLGNVYDWQSHAHDYDWLNNQLYVNQRIADHLWSLYPGQFAGWYISNEVDDRLLSQPATAEPIRWFFSAMTDYLHAHNGNLPVMTSPTYSGLNQSTGKFAQSARQVLGSVDILNVQDGGGSGYIGSSDIYNWFSALRTAFAGSRTAVWQDADMYGVGTPMEPRQLQSNLQATCGLVSNRTGFSFTTQMGPADLGTSYYYDAYKAYWRQARRR